MVRQVVTMISILIYVLAAGAAMKADDCPASCSCNKTTALVNCTGVGLTAIPSSFPSYSKKIILSMNGISEIGDKAFASAPLTTYIDLRHNSISTIGGLAFDGVKHLRTLYLIRNDLRDDVDLTSLSGKGSLTNVYLSFNHFTKIPALQSTSLLALVLDGNNIKSATFPESYKLCSSLQSVVLSHNVIGTISSTDFSNLQSSVKSLDLKLNSIDEIDPSALAPVSSSLETLNLDDNQLNEASVEGALNGLSTGGIPALLVLSLNRNKITKIDQKLFKSLNNGRLRNLQMDGNLISSIDPSGFSAMSQSLELLSLRKCGFSELNFDLTKLTSLAQLALDGNRLTSLPPFLPISLQRLTVAKNLISGWQNTTFKGLSEMTTLDLSSNRLRTIDNGALNTSLGDAMTSMQQINLALNPFNCTCDLAQFLNWAKSQSNEKKVKNMKKYRCSSPDNKRGTFVVDLDVSSCKTKQGLLGNRFKDDVLIKILDRLSYERRVVVEIHTNHSITMMDVIYAFLMVTVLFVCYLITKQILRNHSKR